MRSYEIEYGKSIRSEMRHHEVAVAQLASDTLAKRFPALKHSNRTRRDAAHERLWAERVRPIADDERAHGNVDTRQRAYEIREIAIEPARSAGCCRHADLNRRKR